MTTTAVALTEIAQRCGIPPRMIEGLVAYILTGRPPGSFLRAVLSNDLKEACARADDENQRLLYQYVYCLYNYAPMGCWGSEEQVEAWQVRGGLQGRDEPDPGQVSPETPQ